MSDPRDDFIRAVVRGKDFADVGGLWGTVNEKVSVAHDAGAAFLTMVDVTPFEMRDDRVTNPLWVGFRERMLHLGATPFASISRDVMDFGGPQFDVVHCSGVLYHMPDPARFLQALKAMTREVLILSSSITPEVVINSAGKLTMPASGALNLRGLSDYERRVLAVDWTPHVGEMAVGLTAPATSWEETDYAPWRWLHTDKALRELCVAAGFRITNFGLMWNDRTRVLQLEPTT